MEAKLRCTNKVDILDSLLDIEKASQELAKYVYTRVVYIDRVSVVERPSPRTFPKKESPKYIVVWEICTEAREEG